MQTSSLVATAASHGGLELEDGVGEVVGKDLVNRLVVLQGVYKL